MEKTRVQMIRDFFSMDAKAAMAEIKALSEEEKQELADMIAEVTGWTIKPSR